MTDIDTRLDHPCPKCGYPEAPKTDEAFFFRYKTMSENNKRIFRKAVLALMETEND